MTILLLKGYNNYFNRIHKEEIDITAYKEASTSYLEYPNVNFDPQDGIATTLIVGSPTQQEEVNIPGRPTFNRVLQFDQLGNPDYLIVHDNTNIVSKWFILESVKIRQGQYKLALKRDVLADFNYFLKKAPCYVEKGTVTDPQNPLLFNSEGMKFNEIKQDEILLKDKTNCAWLVGYIKKDIDTEASTYVSVDYTSPENLPGEIYDVNELDWGAAINYAGEPGSGTKIAFNLNADSSKMLIRVRYPQYGGPSTSSWLNRNIQLDLDGNFIKIDDSGNLSTYALNLAGADQWTTLNTLNPFGSAVATVTKVDSEANTAFNNLIADAKSKQSNLLFTADDPSRLNGQVIVKDNVLYTLSVTKVTDEYSVPYSIGESNSMALAYLGTIDGSYQIPDTGTPAGSGNFTATINNTNPGNTRMSVVFSGTRYVINATRYTADETISYTLPYSSQRSTSEDAQYDMFAMPIDPSVLGITVNTSDVRFYDNEDSKCNLNDISRNQVAIASLLCSKLGAGTNNGYCYDLQVLPYCPIPSIETVDGYSYTRINLHSLTNYDYTFIYNNESTPAIRGIVFYPRKANFNTRAVLPLITPNKQIPLENKHGVEEEKEFDGAVFYYSQIDSETDLAMYDYKFPYPVLNSDQEVYDAFNNNLIETPIEFDSLLEVSGTYKDSQGYVHIYAEWDYPIRPWPPFISFSGHSFKATFNWLMPDEAEQIKVNNECDFQRLVSPNYNGMFQFKKARMIDGIHYIDIDCTYKPYTPYIKLNPDFSGLYGQDWNDSTGLICAGDFSIPMMSDAFTNYELANRNYQAIFNRQIDNLDVNQQIAKEQQQFQGIVGIVTGGIGGAGAGAYAGFKASGNPWGAVAGAAVGAIGGTTLSAVGYEKDRQWLQQQQAEARDFSIDQFNYQLGNIQALPQSMTKSSPLSFNNKIWPIMEFFSCTPEEKDVLRNKLRYDGMTIMAVGSLNDYSVTGGYLKGKLIRLSDIDDDSHIAQAIYEEVDKGFYEGE